MSNADALTAEKARLEDQLRFHGENVVNAQEHVENIVKTSPKSVIEHAGSAPKAEVIDKVSGGKIDASSDMTESASKVVSPEHFGHEHLRILKKDWLKEAMDHTRGIKRAMAEDTINLKVKGIYHDQELIKQLERSGQGNGQKAALLKKGVQNAVIGLEKRYGKIFK